MIEFANPLSIIPICFSSEKSGQFSVIALNRSLGWVKPAAVKDLRAGHLLTTSQNPDAVIDSGSGSTSFSSNGVLSDEDEENYN